MPHHARPTAHSTPLITGGAGYIGSHTVRALSTNQSAVVLDSLELGRADAVMGAELVVGDISDSDLVARVCRDHHVTSLVHFAAYKNVGESMEAPEKYFRNNVASTVALIDAAMSAGVDTFVFSSSCSVVGTPAHVPVTEDAPIRPESVYAETKAMVERILHWYSVTKGLRYVSLRYFNAAGASSDGMIGEDWQYSQNLIPLAMKSLLTGGPTLNVFGDDYDTPDGTCIRDYIHVEDLADAHVKALAHLDAHGGSAILNVGTGVGSSVFDVLRGIERIAGTPVPHVVVGRRAGDPVSTFADPSTAERVIGWRAQYGLEHILETAYRWHSSQADQIG